MYTSDILAHSAQWQDKFEFPTIELWTSDLTTIALHVWYLHVYMETLYQTNRIMISKQDTADSLYQEAACQNKQQN